MNFDRIISGSDSLSIPLCDVILSSPSPIAYELLTTKFRIISKVKNKPETKQLDFHKMDVLFRIVEEQPDLLPRIIDNPLTLFEPLFKHLQATVRVLLPLGMTPQCLSYGKDSIRWTALLRALSPLICGRFDEQDNQPMFNDFLNVIIMCSASNDDGLSETAISVLSTETGLTSEQIKGILFDTTTNFPLLAQWPLSETRPLQSIPDEMGHSVSHDVTNALLNLIESELGNKKKVTQQFQINPSMYLLHALVTVLNRADPTISQRISCFSPELSQVGRASSMWTNTDTISVLRLFAGRVIKLMTETRSSLSSLTTTLHILPFLSVEDKRPTLENLKQHLNSRQPHLRDKTEHFRRLILEISLFESYRTPISLIQLVGAVVGQPARQPLGHSVQLPKTDGNDITVELQVEFDSCTEDEDRWLAFTKLCAVSDINIVEI
ncbi:hypothetical protein BLNAU_19473 [Blattamonas nauphoetae]|uniref:Uncharacterized protein n=1 Tax=Blattamonas nauphoetae TaxID=2049346 RepID=A0ABQ9X1Z1_9EUKA|nr:hypothetical protein BLNAU_19473 [Blattamonas nauphoetae]